SYVGRCWRRKHRKMDGVDFATQGQMHEDLSRVYTSATMQGFPVDLQLAGIRRKDFLFRLLARITLVVSHDVITRRQFSQVVEPALGTLVLRVRPGERYFCLHVSSGIALIVPNGPPVPCFDDQLWGQYVVYAPAFDKPG